MVKPRILLLGLLVACRPTTERARPQQVDASPPPPPAPSAAPPPTTTAARQEDEVITLTLAWNDALARRDAPALRRVYGDKIRLYNEHVDRDTAIARKAAAFARAPDYTQSIRSIKVDRTQADRPTVEMLKTWRSGGKETTVRGVLVFDTLGGHAELVEESDAVTDQKRLAKLDDEGCWGLVHRAVLSTSEGRGYNGGSAGTLLVCAPPQCETFQIAAGRFGKDGFQREMTFDVDQRTGIVTHVYLPEPADPAIVARMKAACAAER